VAIDLADEAVQINHRGPIASSNAGPPRRADQLIQHTVELTDMPEAERK
jgi:hypothetical protein